MFAEAGLEISQARTYGISPRIGYVRTLAKIKGLEKALRCEAVRHQRSER
jgi:hypothetical protein